jgi:hypothetical protein
VVSKSGSVGGEFVSDLVQRARHRARIAPLDIVGERLPVQLTSALPEPARELISTPEQIIGNRNSSLHTRSITPVHGDERRGTRRTFGVRDGAYGLLGSWLANVTVVHGDICDGPLTERALNEYEVDPVFHPAAQTILGIANRSPLEPELSLQYLELPRRRSPHGLDGMLAAGIVDAGDERGRSRRPMSAVDS